MTISDLLNRIRFDGSLLGADWYNVIGVQVTVENGQGSTGSYGVLVDVRIQRPRERPELKRFQLVGDKWEVAPSC